MSAINVSVEADDTRLRLRFEKLPQTIRKPLRPVITRLTNQLLVRVKAAQPHRTGRLRSLTHSYIDERMDNRRNFIRGRVRVLRSRSHNTAAAAGALEYGAHRRFEVRAHRARRTSAFGRPTRPYDVNIPAHQRRANIQALRFLRGPAAAQLPRARAEINAAIAEALKQFD